jgi:hypothetical protein
VKGLILVDFIVKGVLHVVLSRSNQKCSDYLGNAVSDISADQSEIGINSILKFVDEKLVGVNRSVIVNSFFLMD